ncbi:hypothetical protein JCM10207_001461 [Rhodosporidiobolus poonsookiae]
MPDKTPIVEPIQKGSANPTSSSSSSDNIHPSPVVDEGPSDSSIPPSQAGQASRPGTQDALRGQGNSATKTGISREDIAPVPSEQGKDQKEYKSVNREATIDVRSGKKEFETSSEKEGEPKVGKPSLDRNTDDNLVEAGTTMSGAASADGGMNKRDPKRGDKVGKAKL